MRRILPFALASAVFAAVASARPEEISSPLAMAHELESRMAAGDGVTLPDPATEIVRHAGTVDLARGDWPAAFHARAGKTVCVAVSPFTGNYEFFDETGECFFALVPVLPTTANWVAPFRHAEDGTHPEDDLYAPWRLVDVWTFSSGRDAPTARPTPHAGFAESAESSGRARSPSAPPFVTRHSSLVTRGTASPATNLCFTAFSFSDTNLFFTAAWPTNDTLPDATLDLYGSTNLLDPRWLFLSSHPATTNPVSIAVAHASLPWYVEPTQHVHDATCVSVTNIVLSPLDGTSVYTNAFWSCETNRIPGKCGFFRLGTRHDMDGDGFYDAAEILVHGTRPDRLDSDGDGVPDGIVPSVWWSNPIWATNHLDADFIVDIVAPTDGSAETILTMNGLRIPLSPGAGSWFFSLPHGQVVSCSASSSSPFFILWAGTSGGSFWNEPDSFETPFWTSGNIAGYHEGPSSCQIAVPVLAVEPDYGGGLLSGGPTNESHVGPDGSVCVHAADGVQRYTWSVAPAVIAAGRTPIATGAVQLESGTPFIDVSSASNVLSGTFGFGPSWTTGGGILWGSLTNVLSAHRCDATLSYPYCSICGDYETFDETMFNIALVISKSLLTLKHDNQATISISRSGPWGDNPPEGTVEIRRSGATNDWLTLGSESDLAPWTARIAGHFDLRGVVSCGDFALTTAVQQIEVQFPSIDQIIADSNVQARALQEWNATLDDCTEVPNQRREHAYWIMLDTQTDTYGAEKLMMGGWITPITNGFVIVSNPPPDRPALPLPVESGATYSVAWLHTHTATTYSTWPTNYYRVTGPSVPQDFNVSGIHHQPGIAYDFEPDPVTSALNGTNCIPMRWPKSSPARMYPVSPPDRRSTP